MNNKTLALLTIVTFLTIACSDKSDQPAATVPEPTPPPEFSVRDLVEKLSSDGMGGRDNLSNGSLQARELIVEELSVFAEPASLDADGNESYFQEFDLGTNILAVVPGGELADEYVIIGAHYDHLESCADATEDDDICNGATDNATGVVEIIDIVRSIAADGVPRRSIIVALWDTEEDGLVGSKYYVNNPVVPLDQTIAYINADNQGSNLLPSLRNYTILGGAETGGTNLIDTANGSLGASTLETVRLSLVFGQGRSDHAPFAEAGVPAVFFTDASSGCYHTVKDDINAVDFPKLEQQTLTASALLRDLLSTDAVPAFDAEAPLAIYEDTVELLRLVQAAQEDFGYFSPDEQVVAEQFLLDLQRIVDEGTEEFGPEDLGILFGGAIAMVDSFAGVDCDPFLAD